MGAILSGTPSTTPSIVDSSGLSHPPHSPTAEEKIEGARWLKVAADAGDRTALFNMAIKCGEEGKKEEMVEYLSAAAEGGHVAASYNYAKSLIRGDGGREVDLERAAELLNFCADEGDPKAAKDSRKLMKSSRAEAREKERLEKEEAGERERERLENMRLGEEKEKERKKNARDQMMDNLMEEEDAGEVARMKKEAMEKKQEDEKEEENEKPAWTEEEKAKKAQSKPTNQAIERAKAAAAKRRAAKAAAAAG